MILDVLDFYSRQLTHTLNCHPSLTQDYSSDWFSGYAEGEIVSFFGEGQYVKLSDLAASYSFNVYPKSGEKKTESEFRGYYYNSRDKRWVVFIKDATKRSGLRYYASRHTEEEARALRAAVRHLDTRKPSPA